MTGESYYGYTNWAVAPLGHPNLRCIATGDTTAYIYGIWVYLDDDVATYIDGTIRDFSLLDAD